MSDSEYLVRGAKLECDKCPGKTTYLLLGNEHNISYHYLPQANRTNTEKDVDILPFDGECQGNTPVITKPGATVGPKFCQQFMNLHKLWDNVPAAPSLSTSIINVGEEAGITMESVLCCMAGGQITPITSGQDYELFWEEIMMKDASEITIEEYAMLADLFLNYFDESAMAKFMGYCYVKTGEFEANWMTKIGDAIVNAGNSHIRLQESCFYWELDENKYNKILEAMSIYILFSEEDSIQTREKYQKVGLFSGIKNLENVTSEYGRGGPDFKLKYTSDGDYVLSYTCDGIKNSSVKGVAEERHLLNHQMTVYWPL